MYKKKLNAIPVFETNQKQGKRKRNALKEIK